MAGELAVEETSLVSVFQCHSDRAVTVTEPWTRETRPRCDAMVTDRPGIGLGVLAADCGPVLLADAEAGVVGAAHAGWKGALAGVLPNTVAAMERLGADRSRTVAALGPCIRQPSYEVGPEFPAPFLGQDEATPGISAPARGRDIFNSTWAATSLRSWKPPASPPCTTPGSIPMPIPTGCSASGATPIAAIGITAATSRRSA